jgi:hypothetical protein
MPRPQEDNFSELLRRVRFCSLGYVRIQRIRVLVGGKTRPHCGRLSLLGRRPLFCSLREYIVETSVLFTGGLRNGTSTRTMADSVESVRSEDTVIRHARATDCCF